MAASATRQWSADRELKISTLQSEIPHLKSSASPTPTLSPTPRLVPGFAHIVVIFFENEEFSSIIGHPQMPNYNRLAQENVLLTQYYTMLHPSLPNYIGLIGGDTFGWQTNYPTALIDAPSLPDLIETSNRTWKTYQESMPEPCYRKDTLSYVLKHNPFIWFSPIVENAERCQRSVVPLTELYTDLQAGTLPDFVFITPNICHSAHDAHINPLCSLGVMDSWLGELMDNLLAYPPLAQNGLIVITWDEGQGNHGCCGIQPGGGRVATILVSAQAKTAFQDDTPYTHYSLLRTILTAWDLPPLGKSTDPLQVLISAPWK
jgi:phospholipase C